MAKIKYHPLIDVDTDGIEKVPMFFSFDRQSVASKHSFFLEEYAPHLYRLNAKTAHTSAEASAYNIHCPLCGHTMVTIGDAIDPYKLDLLACPKCK